MQKQAIHTKQNYILEKRKFCGCVCGFHLKNESWNECYFLIWIMIFIFEHYIPNNPSYTVQQQNPHIKILTKQKHFFQKIPCKQTNELTLYFAWFTSFLMNEVDATTFYHQAVPAACQARYYKKLYINKDGGQQKRTILLNLVILQ